MDESIIQRIRFAKAKIRNIPYYWAYDESLGEERSRKQYMHVLRSFRKQLESLIPMIDPKTNIGDIKLFKEIVNLISPKIKTDECGDTISKFPKNVQ